MGSAKQVYNLNALIFSNTISDRNICLKINIFVYTILWNLQWYLQCSQRTTPALKYPKKNNTNKKFNYISLKKELIYSE